MGAEAADVRDGDDIAGFTVSRLAVDDVIRKYNVRAEPEWHRSLRRRPAEVDRAMAELDERPDNLVRERITGELRPPDRIWDDALLAVIDGDVGKWELPV